MNRILQVIFFAVLLSVSHATLAQSPVRNYSLASATGTYTAITGTNSTAVGNDGTQNGIPIGFNFSFGGRGVTHFGVSTNGFIKLGIGTTTIPADDYINNLTNAPSPNPVYPCIAAFWDNNNRNAGSIAYATTGTAGSRVLTVQWDGVNIGGGATSASLTASFQIKLFEGTNVVKIIYSNTFDNAGAISASIGLNDATSFLSITPAATPTASSTTANNNINSLTNVRGREYTLTPATPLCAAVTSMNVSNITSSGAVLTITAASGATGYRYWVSTTADYPSSFTSSSSTTYTMSGLLSNTTYYVQAEVVCSGGNGSAWYTAEFKTNCTTLSVPYFQNFDSVTAPALPACITKEDPNGGASWNNTASAAQSYSAPNCMVYGADPAIAGNDWFYTPPISLTGGTSYRLSYYYKSQSSSATEQLEVKFGTSAIATAMTNTIVASTAITNTGYNVLERDFTPSTTGVYHVGFHNLSPANRQALLIDDIRIAVTPSCGVPSLLNVSFTNGSSGIVSWTAATTGTISGYQYLVSTSATPPSSGTATTGTSANFSNLLSGQQYYLHVRTVCATNSAWATLSFVAPCAVKQVPYFENFDTAVVVPALQSCYTRQDLNGGTTWATATTSPRSAPNCMIYTYSSTLPGDDWFFTPPVRLVAGLSYALSFYTRSYSASYPEKLEVKYGLANNAAAMINNLTSNTVATTTYFQVLQNFTPAATGDYYFGFHNISDADQFYLLVDDIRVNYSSECGSPAGVGVSTTPNGGTATWQPSATGTTGSYQYAVTNSATPPETGAINTNTAGATLTGLQPASQYYLHVKSLCTSGLYSAWTSYAFTTPCAAVNVPYTENFSTVTLPALPACMSKIDANGGNGWITDSAGTCTPTKALVYKYNSTIPADDWAFTQGLNLTAGVPYELSFNFKGCSTSDIEKLEVKYGNANGIAAMTNLLYSNLNISGNTSQPARAGFTPSVSGVYYIGFHVLSAANQFNLSIDDISVKVSTFCGKPTPPVVTLDSDTTGTITWGRPSEGTPAGYQYELSTSNIPPASAPTIPDTSGTFTAQAGLRFFVHVRTVCANGNLSEWVTTTFETGCGTAKTIPYRENFDAVPAPYLGNCMTLQDLNGGSTWKTDTYKSRSLPNSMQYHYDATLPGNDWAYTPGLSLIAGVQYRLNFYYKARGFTERLEVKWGGAPVADSMTGLLWDNLFSDSTIYRLASVDFTAQRTGTFYIGFHSLSTANKWDLYVDDISVDYAPGCSVPINLTTTITSQSTATASWSAPYNGPATGYETHLSTVRNSFPNNGIFATASSVLLSGLVPGIKYYISVRSACSGNAFSSWITDSIYIPCEARQVPYTENFDGVTAPTLAPCIVREDLNGATTWISTAFLPKSAPNSMAYKFNSTQPGNDWFYTAPLQLTGGTSYRLSFYYKGRSQNSTEKLEVKYGAGNNVNSMTNLIFSDTSIRSFEYLLTQNEFTPAATGVYYIGFHAFSNANQFDLNVDDIQVIATPNCSKPTNLSVVVTGNTTATASWTAAAAGSVTNYQYVVSTSAALPENGPVVNGTSAALVDLVPTQAYFLHVRTVCSGNQYSLWTSIPFTIPCQAYSLPYYENFDDGDLPLLPPCMTVENLNGGNTWVRNEIGSNTSPFSLFYPADAGRNADDWVYTPVFNFVAGTSYRLSFYYKAENANLVEKMEVKYGMGNNVNSMTTLLMSDTNINFTTFRLYAVDFTPSSTGAYNIGFHAISLRNKSYLYVDDIRVAVSPNCSNPVNLAVNAVTGSGGRATWSPSTRGVPTGYQYAITTSSADPAAAGTAVSDSFVTFGGLSPFTQYYFHVRTICTNGISSWFNVPFYTLPNDEVCNALALQLNGAQSCGSTVRATAVNDPALAQGCNLPNFTVWYKYTATSNGNVYLKTEIPVNNYPLYGAVGWYTLSGNCATPGALTLVPNTECRSFGQGGTGSVDILPSPALTAGTTYYIMISGVDYNSGEYCLSLLSTMPPTCTNNVYPANQAQIDPVPGPENDLTFRWRAVAGATGGYDLVLDSVYPPTAFRVHVTDTFYKYTGITYNKNYFWYVIPKDNVGNSSGCSGSYSSFTTYNATDCRPVTNYGCSGGDSISYFSLKGEAGTLISNWSGSSCADGYELGYAEYMNAPAATLQPDSWYSGFVKTGVGNNYVTIWIDFNDNGFFEPGERLLNNLKAGPVSTLYSIMIPGTAPNGTHRLRIRNIYSDDKPTVPTHPCDYYDYSETEDYRVIVDNIGAAPRIAAPGTVGACQVTSATTIDAASNNLNSTVALLDSNNNMVALVYPDGNALGRVNSSLFVDGGAIRQKNGSYYLSRNVTVTPERQPQAPYRFRMYLKNSELDALIATTASGVTGINDLLLYKTSLNNCLSAISNYQVGDTSLVPYATAVLNNGSAFVDVAGLTSFSTFYLSGRHTYRFTGNGNWSNPANWENLAIPPANLPSKDIIIIDNAAGGQCVLDVTQRVGSTGSIIVNAGKKLVIPGALRVQ